MFVIMRFTIARFIRVRVHAHKDLKIATPSYHSGFNPHRHSTRLAV